MVQDWGFYRKSFIAGTFDFINRFISSMDHLTPIEKIMCLELSKLSDILGSYHVSLYTQHQIGDYRVDFLLDIKLPGNERKIVIECDGHDFHEKTKEQASKDKKRDRFLQAEGFIVLRYTGSDIVSNPGTSLHDIMNIIYPAKKVEKNERSVSNQ